MDNWVIKTRNVPSQLAHGWQGGFDGGMASYDSDVYSELVQNVQLVLPSGVPITEDNLISILAWNVNKVVSRDAPLTEDDSAKESVPLLLQLVSLQSYDGSFALNESLAVVLGKTLPELEKGICTSADFSVP